MLLDQPVTLPRDITLGGEVHSEHPVTFALGRWAVTLGMRKTDIANALKVQPQTLSLWQRRAAEDPDFLMPAEQVPPLCAVLHLAPNMLRPDLWPSPAWRFDDSMPIHLRSQAYRRADAQ